MSVVYLGVAWLAGLWLASLLELGGLAWLGLAAAAAVSLILLRRRPQARLALASLLALSLAGARYAAAQPVIDANHVATYNERDDVRLVGLVAAEPDVRDNSVNLRVAAESIIVGEAGAPVPVRGQVLLRAPRYPVIPYGARVAAEGRLEKPWAGPAGSYRDYLARQGIHSQMSFPTIAVLAEGQVRPLRHLLLTFKARAQATILHLVPEPEAALLSGILLGNDRGLPQALQQAFQDTGMTHIIAISGFNIAILAGALMALFQPLLPRRLAAVIVIVGLLLYAALVGAQPSVVRAAIMAAAYIVVRLWLGRPTLALAVLVEVAVLMTLLQPQALWDVGFQLSFAATLGLVAYYGPIRNWTEQTLSPRLPATVAPAAIGVIASVGLVTLAAQLLTLPLIALQFGRLSVVSPLANALILPLQPGAMIWGGLATLTGLLWPGLGQALAWIAWLFLRATTFLVTALAQLPAASVDVHFGAAAAVAVYGLIGGLTWFGRCQPGRQRAILDAAAKEFKRHPWRRLGLLGALLALILATGLAFSQPDGRLHVIFFDVGQGDATFIQTPTGRQILVDGGHFPSELEAHLGRVMPFWDRDLDLVVATHADVDHVGGLPGVFQRYQVARLLTNGVAATEPSYQSLLASAAESGVEIEAAQAGGAITIDDGVTLEVLHPGPAAAGWSDNNNSVALRLVYGDFTLLLTADAEAEAERAMLDGGRPLAAVVYKAGHHGSNTSSTTPFLEAVRPQFVVISVGADNNYGHPHPEMLQRAAGVGADVLRTDELGTIEVSSDGQQLWWRVGRHGQP